MTDNNLFNFNVLMRLASGVKVENLEPWERVVLQEMLVKTALPTSASLVAHAFVWKVLCPEEVASTPGAIPEDDARAANARYLTPKRQQLLMDLVRDLSPEELISRLRPTENEVQELARIRKAFNVETDWEAIVTAQKYNLLPSSSSEVSNPP